MRRLLRRINFPKVFIVLIVTLVVAGGACGLTAVAASKGGDAVFLLAIIESVVMVLCVVCLLFTFLLWVLATIMGVNKTETPGTVPVFNDNNEDHKS